jgi:hypothetical protein
MSGANLRRLWVVVPLLVGLVVGMCLPSVESASVPHHECTALTGGQPTLAKRSSPPAGVWAATIEASTPLWCPSVTVGRPPPLTEGLAPAVSVPVCPARSPPVSLESPSL